MVVCATRGGEGSRAVQQAAIAFAREQQSRLIFLYVVDDSHYTVDPILKSALHDELLWLGRTLVKLAQQRGSLAGVSADFVILEGTIRDQIAAYLRQHDATKLFIGAPRGTSTNVFGDDEIEKFAFGIERETDVPVEIVRPD